MNNPVVLSKIEEVVSGGQTELAAIENWVKDKMAISSVNNFITIKLYLLNNNKIVKLENSMLNFDLVS
jgi:histidine ammonia-lyase